MLTRIDLLAMAGVFILFTAVIVVSFFFYFSIPVLMGMLLGALIVAYFALLAVKKSKPELLNEILYYGSLPVVTFTVTLGIAVLTVVTVPNEVVRRLVIGGFALFACWLMTFPEFVKRELGKRLHPILDTGPAWTDSVYTSAGIALFIIALVAQYFYVDLAE
jgi:hypothetical protein